MIWNRATSICRILDFWISVHFLRYFWFKYDLAQKYYAHKVWPNRGSNSWPPDHDSTSHVTEMTALTTQPSLTFIQMYLNFCTSICVWFHRVMTISPYVTSAYLKSPQTSKDNLAVHLFLKKSLMAKRLQQVSWSDMKCSLLSWSGGHEFKPRPDRTRGA